MPLVGTISLWSRWRESELRWRFAMDTEYADNLRIQMRRISTCSRSPAKHGEVEMSNVKENRVEA